MKLYKILFLGFLAGYCFADTLYVDNTLSNNCTSGNYSIANRDNSGNDGNAYISIHAALDAMKTGDHILLREGVYKEGHIALPRLKNGTAWTEGNYNHLCSYPGEWAVIDGENNIPAGFPSNGAVIGYSTYSASDKLSFWKFERLEITGGRASDGSCAAAFFGREGPFWFTQCYIHDNIASSGSANPGGLKGHLWRECIIEYCHFKNNGMSSGTNHNCADINMYSDYVENPENVNINSAVRKNIIRYNLFESSPFGIKYKNSQWLSLDHSGTHIENNQLGDKIYNNIFINQGGGAIDARQDFVQIYNNIFISSTRTSVSIGEFASDDREPFYACVYNNLFQKVSLSLEHDGTNGGDESSYSYASMHPHFYCYNNIFQDIGPQVNGRNDLNILFTWNQWDYSNIEMNTVHVERNYFSPRSNTSKIINVGEDTYDLSISDFETAGYSQKNYANSTTGMYTDSDSYKINFSHILEGTTTIENGGIGGNHPYLTGVTIPSYVGPIAPDNADWVDVVLGLDSLGNNYIPAALIVNANRGIAAIKTTIAVKQLNNALYFNLQLDNSNKFALNIYDLNGRNIWKYQDNSNTNSFNKNIKCENKLSKGTYIATLKQSGFQKAERFVILR
jgi:hypothetical protein